MAFSTQRATSDGTLSLLDISIEYFDRSEIAVLYDGVLQTSGWSWVGTTDKKISFSPPVPNGVEVMLVRTTDLESVRHVFTLGAAFTTQSLDEDLKQILHIAQEAKENATIEEVFHNLNMHGYRLVNVGPGVADTDGANMLQMNTAVGMAQAAAADAANSAATINVANLLSKAANLSDVADAGAARGNIGAQAVLMSGTNIRTVNGNSLLGSGDIVIAVPPNAPNALPVTRVYTVSGVWSKPLGLRALRVRLVGGGGPSSSHTSGVGGGGGGGGGYSEKYILASALGVSETVTVGVGGVTGTGGTSSFGTHCSATGGAAASQSVGGLGGIGTGGDLNCTGGAGSFGGTDAGGVNNTTAYGVGGDNNTLAYGTGGSSVLGGGGRGTYASGFAGGLYGGGGGSSASTTGYPAAGAQGVVIVEELY